jgi:hypothetical protein
MGMELCVKSSASKVQKNSGNSNALGYKLWRCFREGDRRNAIIHGGFDFLVLQSRYQQFVRRSINEEEHTLIPWGSWRVRENLPN